MDPAESPLPPDKVSFRQLEAKALQDGRRVRLSMEIAPFQERPTIEIKVSNPEGALVATSSVVEIVEPRMTLTLHLRGSLVAGLYTVYATLGYPERMPVDEAETDFTLPTSSANRPSQDIDA